MRTLTMVLALALGACSGDSPPPGDGGHACTGTLYDRCASEHDCSTANCRTFNAQMLEVCSAACGAANPCAADSSGAAGVCDNGLCRPVAANDCTFTPQ